MKVVIGQRPILTSPTARALSTVGHALGNVGQPLEQSRDVVLPDDAALYIQWGWKLTRGMMEAMKRRIPYITLDHGYFEPRLEKVSVSINGFHGKSLHVDTAELSDVPVPEIKPWFLDGDTVYIIGQLQNDRATRGLDVDRWLQHMARKASDTWPRRVVIRPHPKAVSSWEPQVPPLAEAFADAFCVVTWTSSVGPQALVHGIPTIAMHDASMAALLPGVPDVLDRRCPRGREAWAQHLAQREFRLTELDRLRQYVVHCMPEAVAQARAGKYDTEGLRV